MSVPVSYEHTKALEESVANLTADLAAERARVRRLVYVLREYAHSIDQELCLEQSTDQEIIEVSMRLQPGDLADDQPGEDTQ